MAITRTKSPDWGIGEELTSAQTNALDTNVTNALDKRNGQTDTLESTVTVDASGAILLGSANARIKAHFSGARIEADVSGAVIAASAAGAKIRTETGGRFELADNDFPTLAGGHTGATQIRYVPGPPLVSKTEDNNTTGMQPGEYNTSRADFFINVLGWQYVDTGSSTQSHVAYWSLNNSVPQGATITNVFVYLQGAYPSAGHSALPAYMPRVRVIRTFAAPALGSTVALHSSGANVIDSSANAAAYDALHGISVTCDQNNVVDKAGHQYIVMVSNEGGTNALVALAIWGVIVTYTLTDLRPH